MSREEFEQQDRELFSLFESEEAIAPQNPSIDEKKEDQDSTLKKYHRKELMKKILGAALCVLIASALVAAMYVPTLLKHVVNFGILACGMTLSVIVDRLVRWL